MTLSDTDIAKFQKLYESHFGIKISKEAAYDQGLKLLRLVSIIYKPMNEKELELLQKYDHDTHPLLE